MGKCSNGSAVAVGVGVAVAYSQSRRLLKGLREVALIKIMAIKISRINQKNCPE